MLNNKFFVLILFFILILGYPIILFSSSNLILGQPFSQWKYKYEVVLNESAGLDRRFEPVEIHLEFKEGEVQNASREIRVVTEDLAREIPSQVYNVWYYPSGYVKSCNVVFLANVSANEVKKYYILYGNPDATQPSYKTDLQVKRNNNIFVENSNLKVVFLKNDPWISYVFYKKYSNETSLVKVSDGDPIWWGSVITETMTWHLPFKVKNYTRIIAGPIFSEITFDVIWGKGSGIINYTVSFRIYAYNDFILIRLKIYTDRTEEFLHLLAPSNYVEPRIFKYAFYPTKEGKIIYVGTSGVGDLTDWSGEWIDLENEIGTEDNPIGVGIVSVYSNVNYSGWRNGDPGEAAPYFKGSYQFIYTEIAVIIHSRSNWKIVQSRCTTFRNPLHEVVREIPKFYDLTLSIVEKGTKAPVYNASVILNNVNTDEKFEGFTNKEGIVVFKGLPKGVYNVTIKLDNKVLKEITIDLKSDMVKQIEVKIPGKQIIPVNTIMYSIVVVVLAVVLLIILTKTKRRSTGGVEDE
ncbi:MAG: hypothetical protein DRJ47_03590 [Thermoprotei archaeon]|nr:MAG: hypothetical protein DRJ47_03590 [Thermoprotei archaeon]